MDKKSIKDIVAQFCQAIESRGIIPNKVILFGSQSNDTSRKGSDIDVVIISNDFIGKTYWERIDILADAIYEIFEPIEALAMTPDEWEQADSFDIGFARDGEVLFAA